MALLLDFVTTLLQFGSTATTATIAECSTLLLVSHCLYINIALFYMLSFMAVV